MESLLDVLHEEGCSLIRGAGCTYSVDEKTFRQLPRSFGIELNRVERERFEAGKLFRLYAQLGKVPFAHNAIRAVNPENGVLHAKVYCLKYRRNNCGEEFYKVIAASANLTGSDELNVYVSFSSGKKTEAENTFGKSVRDFFLGLDQSLEKDASFGAFINELSEADLDPEGAQFFEVDKKTKEMINNDQVETVISPFVSKSVIETLKPKTLISRADQLDAAKLSGRILCSENAYGDKPAAALHAKAYITKKYIYIGSANATESAFNGNTEVLVRFNREKGGFFEDIEKWTTGYDPCEPDAEAAERREFDAECRRIISEFSYNNDHYIFGYRPDDYELTFQKDRVENDCIARTENRLHTRELCIKKDNFSSEFTLLINGEPAEVDKQKIDSEYTKDVTAAIFGSSQKTGAQATSGGSSGGSTGRSGAGETIVGSLRSIKTPEELLRCRENISRLKNSDQNTDKDLKKLLERFMQDTEQLAAEVKKWTK